MLTAEEATEVAIDAGLNIADAAALRSLADDVDSARKIAARFAMDDMQRTVRGLFPDKGPHKMEIDGPDAGTKSDGELAREFFSGGAA